MACKSGPKHQDPPWHGLSERGHFQPTRFSSHFLTPLHFLFEAVELPELLEHVSSVLSLATKYWNCSFYCLD